MPLVASKSPDNAPETEAKLSMPMQKVILEIALIDFLQTGTIKELASSISIK